MQHRPDRRAFRVLVVEDEPPLARALCRALGDWGYEVADVPDGGAALRGWQREPPDAVLLDLGLPDMDGLDVLQQARALGLQAPVLVLTARALVGDRILGLNFGADGYLVKPLDLRELQARLQALLRRAAPAQGPPAAVPPAQAGRLGGLRWDAGLENFFWEDRPLSLSAREAALLRALLEKPGQARSRASLMRAVYPRSAVREEALEVVAFRLRRKLAPCGVALVTLRGLGYLIRAGGAAS